MDADQKSYTNMMWIWYIFIIIAWRYVFSFMIDTWSPVGIFLVNSMVLIMIIIGVIAIILAQHPTKIGNRCVRYLIIHLEKNKYSYQEEQQWQKINTTQK